MIDVKQAIASAKKYAQDLLGTDDLLLEEVESEHDTFHNTFRVTLSLPKRIPAGVNGGWMGGFSPRDREYKSFRVDKSSGEVLDMSIRQIA